MVNVFGPFRKPTTDGHQEPRSSPASTRGTPSGHGTRASRGTRSSRLAEVSVPGGRHANKSSVDRSTEDDEKEEEDNDEDSMEADEDDIVVAKSKGKGKASKAAVAKNSTRRSGRNK